MSEVAVSHAVSFPGLTAGEIHRAVGGKYSSVRWNLYNAARSGHLFKQGTKVCSATRRRAACWYPVQHTHSAQG